MSAEGRLARAKQTTPPNIKSTRADGALLGSLVAQGQVLMRARSDLGSFSEITMWSHNRILGHSRKNS